MSTFSSQRTYHVSRAFDCDEREVIHVICSNIASNLQSHNVTITQTLFRAHPYVLHCTEHLDIYSATLIIWTSLAMIPASDILLLIDHCSAHPPFSRCVIIKMASISQMPTVSVQVYTVY